MIQPVRRSKVADDIFGQLLALILGGELSVGDRLPPERELAERFQANRATVREALRKLEYLGVIQTRQGDGSRVLDYRNHAGFELLRYFIVTTGALSPAFMNDIMEVRHALLVKMGCLAAERRDEGELAGLRELVERIDEAREDPREWQVRDWEFQQELAMVGGNQVLMLLMNSLKGLYLGNLDLFPVGRPEMGADCHRRILAAVEEGDSPRAAEAMEDYLRAGEEALERSFGPRESGE